MPINNTPGDPAANSYAAESDLATYATMRMPAIGWYSTAGSPLIDASLMFATMMMDIAFDWTGLPTTTTQALRWPRQGMFTRDYAAIPSMSIPIELIRAQCEYALQLGNADFTADDDARRKNVASVAAGPVKVSFQDTHQEVPIAQDMAIRRMLERFNSVSNQVPDMVRMLIPQEWFRRPEILRRPLINSIGGRHRHSRGRFVNRGMYDDRGEA